MTTTTRDPRPTTATTELAELIGAQVTISLRRTDVHDLVDALLGEDVVRRVELVRVLAPLLHRDADVNQGLVARALELDESWVRARMAAEENGNQAR